MSWQGIIFVEARMGRTQMDRARQGRYEGCVFLIILARCPVVLKLFYHDGTVVGDLVCDARRVIKVGAARERKWRSESPFLSLWRSTFIAFVLM